MCDYSLMAFPNRLAREGEELVVHRFPSGSMGLASPDDLTIDAGPKRARRSFWSGLKALFSAANTCTVPAVCIPPSARLLVYGIGKSMQTDLGVSSEEEVKFEQIGEVVHAYRDAIAFRNGRRVRLQELPLGQRMKVVDLGGDPISELELAAMEDQSAQLIRR